MTDLFTELGPLLDEVAIVEHSAEQAWQIIFSDDLEVIAEYDEFRHRLILRTELGKPPPDRLLETYELLLVTNTMWRETGGIQFGLNDIKGEGEVLLMFDFSAENLQPNQLHQLVIGFVDKAMTWSQLIQAGGPPQQPEPKPDLATQEGVNLA